MINNEEMKALCIEGKLSNKELAEHFQVPATEIYAWRSRHGLTMNKCAAIRDGKTGTGQRTPEEIEAEIAKVRKAMNDALKKVNRADERLTVLYKELKEAKS